MNENGLTLVELIISIGILGIIFALTTINLTRLPSATNQATTYDLLIADLKSQQTKAMTAGGDFGIAFTSTSYTFIPSGFVVNLEPELSFTSSQTISFAGGTGEITPTEVTISNSFTNENKVIRLNKYGATY